MSLPLFDALPVLKRCIDGFEQLTPWEKEFVSGLVRIGGSGKLEELSIVQAKTLAALACRVYLLNLLPEPYRKRDEKREAAAKASPKSKTAKAGKSHGDEEDNQPPF